jgi:hypothetical protein
MPFHFGIWKLWHNSLLYRNDETTLLAYITNGRYGTICHLCMSEGAMSEPEDAKYFSRQGGWCQVLVKCWSSAGQVLVKCWSSAGQVLVKCWSSAGQVVIKTDY